MGEGVIVGRGPDPFVVGRWSLRLTSGQSSVQRNQQFVKSVAVNYKEVGGGIEENYRGTRHERERKGTRDKEQGTRGQFRGSIRG